MFSENDTKTNRRTPAACAASTRRAGPRGRPIRGVAGRARARRRDRLDDRVRPAARGVERRRDPSRRPLPSPRRALAGSPRPTVSDDERTSARTTCPRALNLRQISRPRKPVDPATSTMPHLRTGRIIRAPQVRALRPRADSHRPNCAGCASPPPAVPRSGGSAVPTRTRPRDRRSRCRRRPPGRAMLRAPFPCSS